MQFRRYYTAPPSEVSCASNNAHGECVLTQAIVIIYKLSRRTHSTHSAAVLLLAKESPCGDTGQPGAQRQKAIRIHEGKITDESDIRAMTRFKRTSTPRNVEMTKKMAAGEPRLLEKKSSVSTSPSMTAFKFATQCTHTLTIHINLCLWLDQAPAAAVATQSLPVGRLLYGVLACELTACVNVARGYRNTAFCQARVYCRQEATAYTFALRQANFQRKTITINQHLRGGLHTLASDCVLAVCDAACMCKHISDLVCRNERRPQVLEVIAVSAGKEEKHGGGISLRPDN